MAVQKDKRYASIDGLRSYASIGIISMHVMTNGQYALPTPLSLLISPMGEFVYLFMAVSAFSLCCGYYEQFINGSFSRGIVTMCGSYMACPAAAPPARSI